MPQLNFRPDHMVTSILTAAVAANRLVGFDGAPATQAGGSHDPQGISATAGNVGDAIALCTGYSHPLEAGATIAAGDYIRPASDGSGRAVVGSADANCGRAMSAATSGGLFVCRFQDRPASVSEAEKRLKFVGRNFPFGYLIGAGGSDVGGTTRKLLKTVSPITKLCALMFQQSFSAGTYGFGESNAYPRNYLIAQVGFEYGGSVTPAPRDGKETFLIDPAAPLVSTDLVSMPIPGNTAFAPRMFVRPIVAPSGTGTAAAVAGGSLAAQTWYYVVTRTEMGVESGPTAEFSGVAASGNLTLALSWVDSRSATTDYYTVYRSSAAAGTKQYLGRTNGPTKRFVDDGFVADTGITPPAAASYRFNTVNCSAGEASNHNNAGGNGSNQVAVVGTFVTTGPAFGFGVAPNVVIGDDTSRKCVGYSGDSIAAGAGFTPQTPHSVLLKNHFDAAFSDGEINSCNAGRSSCTLVEMVSPSNPGGGRSRMGLLRYADWWIDQHGTNDLGNLRTGPQLAADKLTLGRACSQVGTKFATTTVLPRVTSPTNNCLTIGDQPAWSRESERVWFNTWARNGCQVDGGGTPVLSGGTPSPYVQGVIDICARVEANASNVLTRDGGKWKVPTSPVITGTLTGTPTTTSLPTNLTLVSQEHVSRVVRMTSGAANGQTACVQSNNTTTLTVYTNGSTTQSGIANAGLTATPAAGDTFEMWEVLANEGLHPSLAGHAEIAITVREWLLANVINA